MIGPPEEMAATVQRVFVRFCRVFVFFAARCCRFSSEEQSWSGGTGWVLRGCSGVLLGYYRGTTGALLQSLQSGRTIIDPTYCELERFNELLWAASRYCNTAARCRVTKQCAGQHALKRVSGSSSLSCTESGCGDSMSGGDVQHEQEYAKTNWLSTRPIHHGHNLVGRT
jgi:hypothetical protein